MFYVAANGIRSFEDRRARGTSAFGHVGGIDLDMIEVTARVPPFGDRLYHEGFRVGKPYPCHLKQAVFNGNAAYPSIEYFGIMDADDGLVDLAQNGIQPLQTEHLVVRSRTRLSSSSFALMRSIATDTWSATIFMRERSSSLKLRLERVPKERVPMTFFPERSG